MSTKTLGIKRACHYQWNTSTPATQWESVLINDWGIGRWWSMLLFVMVCLASWPAHSLSCARRHGQDMFFEEKILILLWSEIPVDFLFWMHGWPNRLSLKIEILRRSACFSIHSRAERIANSSAWKTELLSSSQFAGPLMSHRVSFRGVEGCCNAGIFAWPINVDGETFGSCATVDLWINLSVMSLQRDESASWGLDVGWSYWKIGCL